MNSFRLGLVKGSSNYSFFDPDSRLNLSLSNPVGFANRITPLIFNGVKYGNLVDIDKVIDLETGTFKVIPVATPVVPVTPIVSPVEPPKVEEKTETVVPVEEKKDGKPVVKSNKK